MDKALDTYYNTLDTLKNQQGVEKEGSTRRAFATLLSEIAKQKKWTLIEEDAQKVAGRTIYYDGVLRDEWRLPHARWEAKDTRDDLDKEIRLKRDKGYLFDNLLFEDTQNAILFQDGAEALRAEIKDRAAFTKLLDAFLNYEVTPFTRFTEAVTYFQQEIPEIASGLKTRIEEAHQTHKHFEQAFTAFFERCQQALNPNISRAAVDEMLIQHMLTERLIRKIFTEDFVRRNIIAKQVEDVIGALTSQTFDRKQFLGRLERFYTAIEDAADTLASPDDKLYFMNTVYERFFQGYSVKTADTHGIVYTPQPIVDFMCASVEEVLADEFGLDLGEEGVTVLDPAVGTGSFIVNLIKRVNPRYMPQFYTEQLFANEVMLMPYYIASLNAELAYYDTFGQYEPFEGMCYVDTLDLHAGRGQLSLFTEENAERVQRQQSSPVTVVIGNPPYNVGQLNENDNNKNRVYQDVDKRIRETYVKDSKATLNNKLYDMYVRFFRWAIDRLGDRDGVVCMVTNNSFVDQIAFDGMRKHLLEDFTRVYHLDLHGNVRQNPKLSGTTHNVFGIQVGVGITVAIRSKKHAEHKLFYHRVPEFWTAAEKLAFMAHHVELQGNRNALNTIQWEELKPNTKHTWLVSEHADEWETFTPIATKEGKQIKGEPETVFKVFSLGVATNRDILVYGFDYSELAKRVKQFIEIYNQTVDTYKRKTNVKIETLINTKDERIKWTRQVKKSLNKQEYSEYSETSIRNSLYRPFTRRVLYFDNFWNEERYQQHYIFPTPETEAENRVICLTTLGSEKPFMTLISNQITDLHLVGAGAGNQSFPFYTYDEDGRNRQENITDWALSTFKAHYADESISKWDVFYYVYGLLHHPEYREKFADNLKRELPRIPYAADFWTVSQTGAALAELHLNYETGKRHKLTWESSGTVDYAVKKMRKRGDAIEYNHTLTLKDIPPQAWDYKLGNRSALDWLIDQYQVKTDKRSGITSDPNAYSEDPRYIVDLIERVTHVSVETVRLVGVLSGVAIESTP